jgi:hypothetical protein
MRGRIGSIALHAGAALFFLTTAAAGKPGNAKPKEVAPTVRQKPTPAAPTSIAVTVVEVAGARAYLKPGAGAHIRRGAKVLINRKEYVVVQTTDLHSVIEIGEDPPREQDKGQASLVAEEADKVVELPPPEPLSRWVGAWTEAAPPASAQRPRFVSLGGGAERDRRFDLRLSALFGASIPIGERGTSVTRSELNARMHAEPFDAAALDVDVSLQRWFAADLAARAGAQARPAIFVRELWARYARGGSYAGIGRMRYAASTLGPLDGARASTSLGEGFSLGAFGGLLPDPLSGAPSLEAQRFGVETTYARADLGLRPEAALVLHGSTFQGKLDEGRISGRFAVYPGRARAGGHFEVSHFDAQNPWKAGPVELTAAGLDGSVSAGVVHLGASVDLRQPERSRWLASFLPVFWLCRPLPLPPGSAGPEPCDGSGSTRVQGALSAGIDLDRLSLAIGATTIGEPWQPSSAPNMSGGFVSARVLRIANALRIDASGSYSRSTYINMLSGSLGPGLTILDDALDVAVYYRLNTMEYRALPASLVQHGAGGSLMLIPSASVLFTAQSEAVFGDDIPALVILGTVMWRPRF